MHLGLSARISQGPHMSSNCSQQWRKMLWSTFCTVILADFWCFLLGGDPLTYTYLTLLWLKWQNSSFDSFNRGPRKGGEKLSSVFQISNWHLILASLRVLQTFDPILKSWKISFAAHHKVCTSIISEQARIQGRWNGWIFTPLFLSPLLSIFFLIPQILIGSNTLLQKFTPHFKILDPRLLSIKSFTCIDRSHMTSPLKSKTKEPLKFLSSWGIRGGIFISVYNFTAPWHASFGSQSILNFRVMAECDIKLRSHLSKNIYLSHDL